MCKLSFFFLLLLYWPCIANSHIRGFSIYRTPHRPQSFDRNVVFREPGKSIPPLTKSIDNGILRSATKQSENAFRNKPRKEKRFTMLPMTKRTDQRFSYRTSKEVIRGHEGWNDFSKKQRNKEPTKVSAAAVDNNQKQRFKEIVYAIKIAVSALKGARFSESKGRGKAHYTWDTTAEAFRVLLEYRPRQGTAAPVGSNSKAQPFSRYLPVLVSRVINLEVEKNEVHFFLSPFVHLSCIAQVNFFDFYKPLPATSSFKVYEDNSPFYSIYDETTFPQLKSTFNSVPSKLTLQVSEEAATEVTEAFKKLWDESLTNPAPEGETNVLKHLFYFILREGLANDEDRKPYILELHVPQVDTVLFSMRSKKIESKGTHEMRKKIEHLIPASSLFPVIDDLDAVTKNPPYVSYGKIAERLESLIFAYRTDKVLSSGTSEEPIKPFPVLV